MEREEYLRKEGLRMVKKNQYVLGSFETVDDAIEIIRSLKERGCPNEDITLVTRENFTPLYAPKMEGRFVTEDQIMGKDILGTTDADSVWDKMKDVFLVETNGYATKEALDYRTDDDPLYGYQESMDQGGIVVMVRGDKWFRAEGGESELPVTLSREQATVDGGVLEGNPDDSVLPNNK